MVRLLDNLNTLFGTSSLYEVLRLEKDASASQVKKAYYKLSLEVHPDRVSEGEDRQRATEKFQTISQVYQILSDTDKRALYDESGEIDEDSSILEENRNWDSYWRILFKKITIADIEKFEGEYRFSEKEKNDVITAYIEHGGDMDTMLEVIPCSTVEDDVRFKEIIDARIEEGAIPLFDAFKKENSQRRKRRRKKAMKELEEVRKSESEMALGSGEDSLETMILKRHKDHEKEMESFFDHLAAKYGNPSKKSKKSSEKPIKKKRTAK